MRCSIVLLFGTALLRAANPQFPGAGFYWDATQVAIVVGEAPGRVPQNATKMPDRKLRPPFGDLFGLPEVRNSNRVRIGDSFDINLTGNFWAHGTVNRFAYNKTEHQQWMLAIATIDPDDQERYKAAIKAKLHIFLVESARPGRISDTGPIRSPLMTIGLSASERAALEYNLNDIMMTKLHQAILKEQSAAPDHLLLPLLGGQAKLTVDVEQIDLGQPLGVRQHVFGTWMVGNETVFSVQGWKRPETHMIESLEAIDGVTADQAEIVDAIGDWGEASLDDFTIANVFPGGRLLRQSAGYESANIYLERMTGNGRDLERFLYGA